MNGLGVHCTEHRGFRIKLLIHIRKTEPISIKTWRFFLVEADQILYVVVSYEVKVITFF